MIYPVDPLWQRLQHYTPDRPGDFIPFTDKLAAEQGWTAAFAARAIEEYKRFVYLCCILPRGASPPPIVDAVWHLHLTYTQEYWKHFCPDILQRELHHIPSGGGPAEALRHGAWYAETRSAYADIFGAPPPADIWPVPRRKRNRTGFFVHLLCLLPLLPILSAVLWGKYLPFFLTGREFLLFYAALAGSIVAEMLIRRWRGRRKLRSALQDAPPESAAEMAWLCGGEKRLALLLLADGIACGGLLYRADERYDVMMEKLAAGGHPLTEPADTGQPWSLETVRQKCAGIAAAYERKYRRLLRPFEPARDRAGLALFFATGAIRLCQGYYHDMPTRYLLSMMIIALLLTIGHARSASLESAACSLLRQMAMPPGTTEISRRVVLTGFAALAGTAAYAHLSGPYRQSGWAGTGGGESSCGGSSCSSCGGGCGGCGGCGG